MDEHKRKWLYRHGFRPITEQVLQQWAGHFSPIAKARGKQFVFYKRFGKIIMPYSEEYLEHTDLLTLKHRNRRNYINFVLKGIWPLSLILRLRARIIILGWRAFRHG